MGIWLGVIGGVYAAASVVTFAMYAIDKRAAVAGRWRTPEATLHLAELLGGWPGGLAARRLLRHKSRKLSFRVVSWGVIALHAAAWAGAGWWWSQTR